MGIIFPKKAGAGSKALAALLFIGLSPILIIAVLAYFLWELMLYMAIWCTSKKQLIIFVYSDSPLWKSYIENEILPYLRDNAIILNWSDRRNWKNSLAVLAFRHFGGHRNFNPMGMVFRPFRSVKTYRFFEAFKEFKHGNARKVEEIKGKFFGHMGG